MVSLLSLHCDDDDADDDDSAVDEVTDDDDWTLEVETKSE